VLNAWDPHSAGKVVEKYRNDKSSVFMSKWFNVHPDYPTNEYKAIAIFPIKRSFLNRPLKFFLCVKDETSGSFLSMPNKIVGFAQKTAHGLQLNTTLKDNLSAKASART
jgi:hypothetical protein